MEETTLDEIRKHIEETREPYDSDFFAYESKLDLAILKHYWYNKLQWCGCGDPEDALEEISKYLKALQDFEHRQARFEEYFGVKTVYDNHLLLCLAYALDAAEFTEHGTSILGAWLEKDGRYFLYAIEKAKESGAIHDL